MTMDYVRILAALGFAIVVTTCVYAAISAVTFIYSCIAPLFLKDPDVSPEPELKRCCKNCEAFNPVYPGDKDSTEGYCCRYTPEADALLNSYWPKVSEDDWCLEFVGKKLSVDEYVDMWDEAAARNKMKTEGEIDVKA